MVMEIIVMIKLTWKPSVQFSHVWLTLSDPMNCSMPGFPIHHQLPEFTQTHVHWVGDAIQPSHPLSSPSPAFNLAQNHGLLKWVSSSLQVAKVLEFPYQFAMKWWNQMPGSSFPECWVLSQLFHSPLSLSPRDSLVLRFLP